MHVDPARGWAGGQLQLLELYRGLRARSHEQAVVCRPDGALRSALAEEEARTHGVAIHNEVDLPAAFRLHRVLRRERADIVHFHTAKAHALSLWLPRGSRCFVVSRLMDYPPHFRPRVHLLYNRRVHGVIAVSTAVRDVLIQSGVNSERVRVIHNGLDPERFSGLRRHREEIRRDWEVRDDDVVLFTAAVLEPRKGHRVVLQALAALATAGLRPFWIICGEGSQREALQAEATRLGLAGRVRFLGFRSDVLRLLAAADVFCLPSHQEGLGLAAVEAMFVGLPVVASGVGGLADVVVHEETGLLVPPGEPKAWTEALRPLIVDPARRAAYGEQGRRRAHAEFSREHMTELTERYYRELLASER